MLGSVSERFVDTPGERDVDSRTDPVGDPIRNNPGRRQEEDQEIDETLAGRDRTSSRLGDPGAEDYSAFLSPHHAHLLIKFSFDFIIFCISSTTLIRFEVK
jgi:hypothetical protein